MKQRNKHIRVIGISMLLITVLFSCKKNFLEVTPKGNLIAQTVSDYNLMLNSLSLENIDSQDGAIAMGDEVAAANDYFSSSLLAVQRRFAWDAVVYDPGQVAVEMTVPMQNLYTYNAIINGISAATDGTAQQKASIQAEAMAGRAWTNFMLINYYGKPYAEATAATDPGFPIITVADVTQTKFVRASVKDMYDFIVSDLTSAIAALPAQTTFRSRMSKPAAEGLLAKVYMFMGKFSQALPLLNQSFTDMGNSTIPIALYNYNVTFATGGSFLPLGFFGPTYPSVVSNTENLYSKQAIDNWTFTNNELVISPATVALFGSSDLRLNFYANSAFFGANYPGVLLRRVGPIEDQYGVVLPDLYLLRAECKARLGDLAGAKTDVETLRSNRMPAADASVPAATAGKQLSLLNFIFDERTREFAVQGYRWFDMRRLSVDPLFTGTTYTHTLYSTSGSITSTFALDPLRFTMRFPQTVIDENPGMENNP
ncbi:RagB/SusD family nutrient uptake outer membrane protein [Mucilaginibacter sp. L196]|uniref:RagB/SusD family nutrient uptake outer membrane protein n=1 Tax=Mucilaginibacter sp. L196 TaxID=1641870 RepID=UPI00131CC2F4|nr:RagB/SusD family nutrient uptake outer membrane protein [Mucilaginibacter sp. L196]